MEMREPTTAEKLFWENVMRDMKNSTSRRVAEDVARIKAAVAAIEDNTGWLSKWMANIFKSAAGEAEKKYPSRRK